MTTHHRLLLWVRDGGRREALGAHIVLTALAQPAGLIALGVRAASIAAIDAARVGQRLERELVAVLARAITAACAASVCLCVWCVCVVCVCVCVADGCVSVRAACLLGAICCVGP